jgi:hypothetical protein
MPDLRRHLRDKNSDQPRAGLSVHLLNSILHFQKDTVMKAPVEFWFDFVSPYAYIAAQSIEQLAARHGREVSWKPMLLGAVFKVTGSSPLTMRPPQMADYFKHDFALCALCRSAVCFAGTVSYRNPEYLTGLPVAARHCTAAVSVNSCVRSHVHISPTGSIE